MDSRSYEKDGRQVAGRRGVRQDNGKHQSRRGAWSRQSRRYDEPHSEHLNQESREEKDVRIRQGRTVEYGDQDLYERGPVLEIRQGRVPQAACLQSGLSAMQILRIADRWRRG